MQEVIYNLEKLDISEEINRLKSHLVKFDEMLQFLVSTFLELVHQVGGIKAWRIAVLSALHSVFSRPDIG